MQLVQIYGSDKMKRNVYAMRVFRDLRYEVGYVHYGTLNVPVWRPLDQPEVLPHHEILGIKPEVIPWRNIYSPRMHVDADHEYVRPTYKTERRLRINFTVPTMTLEYAAEFRAHLEMLDEKRRRDLGIR